jgi:hypothetical protein
VPAPLTISVPDTGAAAAAVAGTPDAGLGDDPQDATSTAAHAAENQIPNRMPRRIGGSFCTMTEPIRGYPSRDIEDSP